MRVAVHGILSDNGGSGAGSFPLLLAGLLERGHDVEFFGNPGYVRPTSLERFPNYRFRPLRVEAAEAVWNTAAALPTDYPRAFAAQVSHVAYQRAAAHAIERLHRENPYSIVLCTDFQALWPCRLPVISWPQSPPHTEAAALSDASVRAAVRERWGAGKYAAVRAYYAYRALLARGVLPFSNYYLCATRWAEREWVRFGLAPERIGLLPYPLDLSSFSDTTPVGTQETLTVLWLGRATPRKRLDLFLAAFQKVRARRPGVRARVVGNVAADPVARRLLAEYAGTPDLVVEDAVPRPQIPALLREVDVVVQPSQRENFGFSVAEALAAGRLVVAGPTNGTLEYAAAAGFGFAEYTPDSVARSLESALDAARTRGDELSAAARAAATSFSIPAVVEGFCRHAETVIARERGLRPHPEM